MCIKGRETKRNDIMYEERRKNCESIKLKKNRKDKRIRESEEDNDY